MFEFLLSSTIACADADVMILRIEKHENLKAEWKLELIETIQDYTSECPWDANDWRNGAQIPSFRRPTMNTLNLIKKQINKAAALHDAQISHTSYRGVEYDTRCVESKETHGTFCYRGKTYTKWLTYNYNMIEWEGYLPFFMERDKLKLIVRNLKLLVEALESEVYSDPTAYTDKRENFDDPASYYAPISDYDEIFNDDDGYPD